MPQTIGELQLQELLQDSQYLEGMRERLSGIGSEYVGQFVEATKRGFYFQRLQDHWHWKHAIGESGHFKNVLLALEDALKYVPKPPLLPRPNLEAVLKLVSRYVDNVQESCGDDRDDLRHYVFEAVMEAYYGPKVWDYLNKWSR
jgi:hypothetical protein